MAQHAPHPILSVIVAADAPIAVVFRRGQRRWFQVLRWHLDTQVVDQGVWVRKKIAPEKCDLSSDGQLLLFCLSGDYQGQYKVYSGISRLPWLHPLTSWEEDGTYGCGHFFISNSVSCGDGDVREHDLDGRIVRTREQRDSWYRHVQRGWVVAPPVFRNGQFEYGGPTILRKWNPVIGCAIRRIESSPVSFEIDFASGTRTGIADVTWADWDHKGRLLLATKKGRLVVEEISGETRVPVADHDLSVAQPIPIPPPDWARSGTAPEC